MGEPRTPEGLVLFEVYEASGALLVVTSDGSEARAAMEDGDLLFRRPWATAAAPVALIPTPTLAAPVPVVGEAL